ncbi:helix-turn-helix domain-containing protein [Streptomyces marincola]|uniref:helix-turn-helix domain-containing protein n=1 Tax=Streptomyces marincola TaxID=2878388 RepID=UPI0021001638|nr:helix-turn-helix transcriptional regulator [Streptomyces marincola]
MDDVRTEQQLSGYEYFGSEVRSAREDRKLTQRRLADGTGYSIAYVSKVENGVLMPSARFAERLDVVFGTGGLFSRLRRRIDETETPSWFVPYLKLEPKAHRILDWSVHCFIGVLQTEEYARAILRAGNPHEDADTIEGMVRGRMRRRQEALEKPGGPKLWAVIHEACIRTVVGGPDIMAAQLDDLIHVANKPDVDVQIVPFTAGAAAAHTTSFTLLTFSDKSPDTLWTDGPHGGRLTQVEATVKNVAEMHERLRAHAAPPDTSMDTIRTCAEELR